MSDIERLKDFFKNRVNGNIKNFFLNTGTSLDMATGYGIQGRDGHFYLNGGLTITNSIIGRPQTYKSSMALSYFSRALTIYNESMGLVHDAELTIPGVHRILNLAGLQGGLTEDRIILTDQTEYDMTSFTSFMEEIANKKEKEKDLVETPFINSQTGKFYLSYRPMIVAIDSFSAMKLKEEFDLIEEEGLNSSKTNTLYMANGNAKTKLMPHFLSMGAKLGIYFIFVGQIGNKINMNSFIPETKDMQYMKQGDGIKNVGAQFEYLSSNMIETRSAALLQDSNKECLYPGDLSNDVELQTIKAIITKCKNNSSGGMLKHISSQQYGLQPSLEWIELLKEMKYFGFESTAANKTIPLLPKVSFTRKNVREKLEKHYELQRGIELLGQFAFIRKYWAVPRKVKDIPPTDFIKVIESKISLDELLNTRGYWTYNEGKEKEQRKYLNILDIINWI